MSVTPMPNLPPSPPSLPQSVGANCLFPLRSLLVLPDFSQPFVIETDAFGVRLGATLMRGRCPMAYFSMAISGQNHLRPVYEWILMVIVPTIQKWHYYLLGQHFTIYTDKISLHRFFKQTQVQPEYQSGLAKVLVYDFFIAY